MAALSAARSLPVVVVVPVLPEATHRRTLWLALAATGWQVRYRERLLLTRVVVAAACLAVLALPVVRVVVVLLGLPAQTGLRERTALVAAVVALQATGLAAQAVTVWSSSVTSWGSDVRSEG
jgi:hypothetical protein